MSFRTGEVRTDFQARCPYNPNHMMPESRLLYHLTNGCKDKQLKGHLFDNCPYNYLHIIYKDCMDVHLLSCKDKPAQNNDDMLLLQQAIKEQFSTKKKVVDVQEVQDHNTTVPGFATQQPKQKKKRVRNNKKFSKFEKDESDDDMPNWDKHFQVDNQDKSEQQEVDQFDQDISQIQPSFGKNSRIKQNENNVDSDNSAQLDDWTDGESKIQIKSEKKNNNNNSYTQNKTSQQEQVQQTFILKDLQFKEDNDDQFQEVARKKPSSNNSTKNTVYQGRGPQKRNR